MPYIPTSQEWLAQSSLLLEARPSTARVTTKYNIKSAKARKAKKDATTTTETTTTTTDSTTSAKPPRATLILKTFDPSSGVCLKYKTTKAAEVSRLVQLLGSLGRKMAALPDAPASAVAALEDDAAAGPGTATPPVAGGAGGGGGAAQTAQQGQGAAGGGGGGGKGKKKKGKR